EVPAVCASLPIPQNCPPELGDPEPYSAPGPAASPLDGLRYLDPRHSRQAPRCPQRYLSNCGPWHYSALSRFERQFRPPSGAELLLQAMVENGMGEPPHHWNGQIIREYRPAHQRAI